MQHHQLIHHQLISELAKDKLIEKLAKNLKIKKDDFEDFCQEIYLILLEYPATKIIDLHKKKQLKFFIVRIMLNQYFSKTSPFYKKYKLYAKYILTLNEEFNTNSR